MFPDDAIMRAFIDGDVLHYQAIDEEEAERVRKYLGTMEVLDETKGVGDGHQLYEILQSDKYSDAPYQTDYLGEDMSVVSEFIGGWLKNRFLLNDDTEMAYEFMDMRQRLRTITQDDIDWESIYGLPLKAVLRAKDLSFRFPSHIKDFKNGVAEVSWQVNPDGRFYEDEEGFGATRDKEITIYGFIDREGKAVVKFKAIKDWEELETMRKDAEKKVIERDAMHE